MVISDHDEHLLSMDDVCADLNGYLCCSFSVHRGPFLSGQGPLDAQVKLLEFTLEQSFESVSVGTIMAVIESITFLVHHYITCSDKVVSRSGSDSSVGARACFGGLFANIIRPGDAKAVCGETTRDQLMFNLLKLVNTLVKLPLTADGKFSGRVPPAGNGSSDSVSDEEKVCGSKEGAGPGGTAPHQGPAVGVADLVLGNQQVMSQILSALGQCNSSAMAMIIGKENCVCVCAQGGFVFSCVCEALFCLRV